MATRSTAGLTIEEVADALAHGPLARDWQWFARFPGGLPQAAAWCAAVEDIAPDTAAHGRAMRALEHKQAQVSAEHGAPRARDQLILGWDWWRWYASRRIEASDETVQVAA